MVPLLKTDNAQAKTPMVTLSYPHKNSPNEPNRSIWTTVCLYTAQTKANHLKEWDAKLPPTFFTNKVVGLPGMIR